MSIAYIDTSKIEGLTTRKDYEIAAIMARDVVCCAKVEGGSVATLENSLGYLVKREEQDEDFLFAVLAKPSEKRILIQGGTVTIDVEVLRTVEEQFRKCFPLGSIPV